MKQPDSPFFLQVNQDKTKCSLWFKAQPLGDNSLRAMIPKMCKAAGIRGNNYTNHSLGKQGSQNCCTKMFHRQTLPSTLGIKMPQVLITMLQSLTTNSEISHTYCKEYHLERIKSRPLKVLTGSEEHWNPPIKQLLGLHYLSQHKQHPT